MGAIDEDEAIYKIMMAEHYISIIQDSPELINLIKTHINLGSSGQVPHTNAWGAVKPLLGIIGLQINKPKELEEIERAQRASDNYLPKRRESADGS